MIKLWEETKPYQKRFAFLVVLNLLVLVLVVMNILEEDWVMLAAVALLYPVSMIFMFQALFTLKVQKDVLLGRIPHNEAAMRLLKEYRVK